MLKIQLPLSFFLSLSLCCLITKIQAFSFYCSKNIYAAPNLQDCYKALAAFPTADGAHRYFVEPQMRLSIPQMDWTRWEDPRLPSEQQRTEQLPKYWSSGIKLPYSSSPNGDVLKDLTSSQELVISHSSATSRKARQYPSHSPHGPTSSTQLCN